MKRGRKSFSEHDRNYISRICDTKSPWPWPKITPFEIKYEFETGNPLPFLTEQYMIRLYNHGARKWNKFVRERRVGADSLMKPTPGE